MYRLEYSSLRFWYHLSFTQISCIQLRDPLVTSRCSSPVLISTTESKLDSRRYFLETVKKDRPRHQITRSTKSMLLRPILLIF